ncbi:DUF6624 domain-containing protein, partial [Pontibacter silvestris]
FLVYASVYVFGQATKQSEEIPQDTLLKKELETIRMKDQTLRLVLPMVEEKFGKNSEERKYLWSLINYQDSINVLAIKEIIEKEGWLGTNRVGYFANQSIWMVIQHAPLGIQEKYLPYLKKSVAKGESEGWYLAFLEDRILMRNGEKQKYGSQSKFNKQTGKNHIYPIMDYKNVNKRRAEIGL